MPELNSASQQQQEDQPQRQHQLHQHTNPSQTTLKAPSTHQQSSHDRDDETSSLASTLVDAVQQEENPKPYKGFPSEQAYLRALNEWADSKRYIQPDAGLVGFYGTTTMEQYASRPKVELGITRRWKERKAKKEERRRSGAAATAAQ